MRYTKVYDDRTRPGGNRLIGITEDYVVEFICSTCVFRVLDKRGADYGKLMSLMAKGQNVDIYSNDYLTDFRMINKVLWNIKPHHINKWMRLNKIIQCDELELTFKC